MVQMRSRQLSLNFGPPSQPATASSPKERLEAHRQRIAGYLTMRLPQPVDLVFTDNRSTMISYRPKKGRLAVRLHRMFRHADDFVLEALVRYLIGSDQHASRIIDRFIADHRTEIRGAQPRPPTPPRTKGNHHDITAVLERINRDYFGGQIDVQIGWGRAPARKRNRRRKTMSRALATYCYDDRTIRISPVLDAPDIPAYMLEWVVYHEVLHHVLPIEVHGRQRRYHTQQFKAYERAFRHYEQAKEWERTHLDRLLS